MSHLDSAKPTLVAYATRGGSTRGIAERIAGRLNAAGHDVVVRECSEVSSLEPYAAVVFGSAVYDQRWLPEATDFVGCVMRAAAGLPVFLFSVGSLGDTSRLFGALVWKEPKGIQTLLTKLHAQDYRVFAGVISADFPWFSC